MVEFRRRQGAGLEAAQEVGVSILHGVPGPWPICDEHLKGGRRAPCGCDEARAAGPRRWRNMSHGWIPGKSDGMDSKLKHIEEKQVVERYLRGRLTPPEARFFEQVVRRRSSSTSASRTR